MNQSAQEHEAAQRSPVARAEELLNRFGQRLSEVRARRAPQGAGGAGADHTQGQPLERAGEQLGMLVGRASREIRKVVARTREEAADLWAEAQSVRQENERKPPSTNGESRDA